MSDNGTKKAVVNTHCWQCEKCPKELLRDMPPKMHGVAYCSTGSRNTSAYTSPCNNPDRKLDLARIEAARVELGEELAREYLPSIQNVPKKSRSEMSRC